MKKELESKLECLFDETYKPDMGWLVIRFSLDLEFNPIDTKEFMSLLRLASRRIDKSTEAINRLGFKIAKILDNDFKWHLTGCGELEYAIFVEMKNDEQNELLFNELKKLGFEKWNN